jgi:hypothetical protein
VRNKNNRGFLLILTLLYTFLITAFLGAFLVMVTSGLRQANRTTDGMRAYYVADAGLADALMQLRAVATFPAAFNVNNASYPVGPNNLNGSYTVTVTTDGAVWPTYTLASQGVFGSAKKTLTLRVKTSSYSRWNYLSLTEIHPTWGNLWWVTGMYAEGPIQTDGQFNIWGSPVFNGPVSQAASTINYGQGGPPNDNPNFEQGLTLSAPAIPFPTTDLLNSVKNGAAQGISLTGATTVTLVSNGTMNVTNSAKGWNAQNMAIPANGALYVDNGDVTVQGTLKGQLTIATNQNIWISGNVRYNTDPMTTPSSTDLLGLVANSAVTVKQTAPSNLRIDGYIVALTDAFQLENFSVGGFKGNMIQFGGLMNKYCGPTGVMDWNGNIIDGYNQLQYYDTRFKNTAPPFFTAAKDATNRIVYSKVDLKET